MITKLEDLEDTEHNRRYGREIVRKSLMSNRNQWESQLNWILSDEDLVPFVATVTFKRLTPFETKAGFRRATEYEFEKWVLNKVRKRLSRSSAKWGYVLPVDWLYIYEHEQGSFFKPIPKSNSPHHVHGVFPVRKHLASRIYDFKLEALDARLHKDLSSIANVSTFLIEPMRVDEASSWVRYMLKGKNNFDRFG